jgi:hypothetical protein
MKGMTIRELEQHIKTLIEEDIDLYADKDMIDRQY